MDEGVAAGKRKRSDGREEDCCCFVSCMNSRRGTRMDGCTRSSCCLLLACSMRMLLVDLGEEKIVGW
jgi:hypothetical protein